MRAWLIEDRGRMVLGEAPNPEPGPGEILIRVEACGICRTDLHILDGDLPLVKRPLIPGHEIAGRVVARGEGAERFPLGRRVGVSWLHSTCGRCKWCRRGMENYCPHFVRTGYDVDGGYAEYHVVHEDFAFDLGDLDLPVEELAPLMCPGIAGFAAFRLAPLEEGDRLGIVGFGPSTYYVALAAGRLGIEVYISTRSGWKAELAEEVGAAWVGNALKEGFPRQMDAIISFPPVGDFVEKLLSMLPPGGTLVLAPVHSTPIRIEDYTTNLWGRTIKTLYNVNRRDAKEFLSLIPRIRPKIPKRVVPFDGALEELRAMRKGLSGYLVSVMRTG